MEIESASRLRMLKALAPLNVLPAVILVVIQEDLAEAAFVGEVDIEAEDDHLLVAVLPSVAHLLDAVALRHARNRRNVNGLRRNRKAELLPNLRERPQNLLVGPSQDHILVPLPDDGARAKCKR